MLFFLSLFLLLFFGISFYCYLELSKNDGLDGITMTKLRHRMGGTDIVADEGASLVKEVLADLPAENKGEREEWSSKTGVHRKEDIFSPSDSKPEQVRRNVAPHNQEKKEIEKIEKQDKQEEDLWSKMRELYLLAQSNPLQVLHLLEDTDPFHTKTSTAFVCPHRTLDDRMMVGQKESVFYSINEDNSSAYKFRHRHNSTGIDKNNSKGDYGFIWYQHLRKAGGTGFCELAKSNMLHQEVPPYYCMPDFRGSLATPPWHDGQYLYDKMLGKHWRVCSNEWDAYNSHYHNSKVLPGAVFVTSMRHPLDRWYSQYRFEHLEHRDGSAKDAKRMSFQKYYNSLLPYAQGNNYYVKTFAGHDDQKKAKEKTGDFYWTFHKYRHRAIDYVFFLTSVQHLCRDFHLILITEMLDNVNHMSMIHKVLGWTVKPQKVLPHESQALRGSVEKAELTTARSKLTPAQWDKLGVENIYDVLMYHVVRRVVLERMYGCR